MSTSQNRKRQVRQMNKSLLIMIVLALCCAGCSLLPRAQHHRLAAETLHQTTHAYEAAWWQAFDDPLMTQLAHALLAQNVDIKIARARIAEARGVLRRVQSGWFPEVAVTGSVVRGDTQPGFSHLATIAQGGFDASWEIDIFGQTRAEVNATKAKLVAQVASLEDAQRVVLAELMRAVIEWRQAQETYRETQQLLATQDAQIALFSVRTRAGLIDATLLARAQAERAQTATRLPLAQAAGDAASYKIAKLLAQPIEALRPMMLSYPAPLKVPKAQATLQLDIASLRTRPDIRSLRAEMLAAQFDLAKAEADLWPRLSLSAFFGVQEGSNGLLLASNPIGSLGLGVTLPWLNFGRLRGAIDAADARARAASLNYENAVLAALQETQTALSDYLQGINTVAEQEKALQFRQQTVTLASRRFERGLTDMTDLTTAQSELNQATLVLVERRALTAVAYIRLQKALGSNAS